jgi:FkbM family methyltransferase
MTLRSSAQILANRRKQAMSLTGHFHRTWQSACRKIFRPSEVLLGNIRIGIDASLMPDPVIRAIFRGDYELNERMAVEHMVRPGDRIVEFGGGIGAVAVTAARIAGPRLVSVFEPQPQACELIRRNAALNGVELDCWNAAVARDSGKRAFYQSPNIISSSFFDRQKSGKQAPIVREVSTIAVSDILESVNPNVMIVDIEGAETEVFEGVDLRCIEVLVIEMHPHIVGEKPVAALDASFHAQGLVGLSDLRHADTYVYSRGREP